MFVVVRFITRSKGAYNRQKTVSRLRTNSFIVKPTITYTLQLARLGNLASGGSAYYLFAPVRLGMQIAFGRVRRKTAPTGC